MACRCASVWRTNGTSLSVSHCVQDACAQKMTRLVAWPHQGLAFFGPFSGYDTAGRQGTEVASMAELIANPEFTLKLVPFVEKTDARTNERHSIGQKPFEFTIPAHLGRCPCNRPGPASPPPRSKLVAAHDH